MRFETVRVAILTWGATLPLCLAAGGCVSLGGTRAPRAIVRYYGIHVSPGAPMSRRLPHTLAIRSFSEDGALDRDSIRYRTSPVEGGYRSDSRWSQNISQMVRAATMEDLEAAKLFRSVVLMENVGAADILLDGRVDRFEEVDEPDGPHAVAVVTFDASATDTGKVFYHRRIAEDVKCASRSPGDVAEGLSTAVDRMLSELRSGLSSALSAR